MPLQRSTSQPLLTRLAPLGLAALVAAPAAAQRFHRTVQTTPGDVPTHVARAADEDYLVLGMGPTGDWRGYLHRISKFGTRRWSVAIAGAGLDGVETADRVLEAANGDILVCGRMEQPQYGERTYLARFTAGGALLWSQSYEGPVTSGWNHTHPVVMDRVWDGGFILASTVNISTCGDHWMQPLLIRTDANGALLWMKSYSDSRYTGTGAAENTVARFTDIRSIGNSVHPSDGFVMAGLADAEGPSCGPSGPGEAFLLEVDASGTPFWSTAYGATSPWYDDGSQTTKNADPSLARASGGDWVLSFGQNGRARLLRTNSTGTTVWSKRVSLELTNWFRQVRVTSTGSVVAFGTRVRNPVGKVYEWDPLLTSLSGNGDFEWSHTYRISDSWNGRTFVEACDRGFLLGMGLPYPSSSPNPANIELIKTDSLGNHPCTEHPATPTVEDVAPSELALTWLPTIRSGTQPGSISVASVSASMQTPCPAPVIDPRAFDMRMSEIYANHVGVDTHEFIELEGPVGASLDGVVLMTVEGDGAGAGTLDNLWDLSALSIPASGRLVLGDSAVAPNDFVLGAQDALENGSQTIYLAATTEIASLTSLVGTNVAIGTATHIPCLTIVLDKASLDDGDLGDIGFDDAQRFGPDPTTGGLPPGVSRCRDASGDWRADFLDFDFSVPGPNPPSPGAPNGYCAATPVSFCSGDGADANVTTPCPCANFGGAGRGCANSIDPSGALLAASGSAFPDTIVLSASGMPSTVTAIYLQGDALTDTTFGDGIRCIGGSLLRLRARASIGGASSFPDASDTVTLSERGGVVVGSGMTLHYQTYYRNAAVAFCPPATFNVTNGVSVTW